MEHLRMSGEYLGLTALNIMGRLGDTNVDEIFAWILKCQDECGGFGGNYQHDPHILYTLSAVQILCMFDRLEAVDGDKIARRLMRCWYDRY
ncbi:hypothetical protein KC19_3G155800 [Ceratodon purpureus]|uniref:Geranylgeranyl transferase type II subunit beta n=1 Tax=Ceratodon purpureus TaxID=3225 RepID=A0A8T0IKZ0_CERPU|nr:hypothetical protein KC19_3G155800 [Ceratodon purpureus]